MHKFLLAFALLLTGLGMASESHAAECTEIANGGYSITAGGHYCLGSNVVMSTASGFAVSINADNVELDCRGYSIANLATASTGNAYAVYVTNHRNVHVRNCHITGGWVAGIYAYQDNGLANQNSDLTFTGNTISGTTWYGILAYGTGVSIHDNRISRIGGRASFAMGIRVGGSTVAGESRFAVVQGNEIADVRSPVNNAYGIYGNNVEGSLVVGNAIYGVTAPTSGFWGYGVLLNAGSERNRITGNTVVGSYAPDAYGIQATGTNPCFDNVIRNVTTYTIDCDATHGNF